MLTKAATKMQHHHSLTKCCTQAGLKNGAPLQYTGFISLALRGDTKEALELNTETFGTARRALGPTREPLGPSVTGATCYALVPLHCDIRAKIKNGKVPIGYQTYPG